MKKYILLIVFVCFLKIAFSQKYRAESIEEGLQKGADNIKYLTIKYKNNSSIDFTKLPLFKNLIGLSITKYSTFPIEITQLSKLEELTIDESSTSFSIPKEISKLINLKTISIDSISSLPQELFDLTNIYDINLKGKFNKIPTTLQKMINLKKLYLKSSKGFLLPDNIEKLEKLEDLMIENPDAIFPKSILELKNLKRLMIFSKKMQVLPDSISKLNKLTYLYINAPIKSLPTNFGELKKLTELDLFNTQLKDLPSSFSKLSSLRELHLNKSLLTKIPDCLYDLSHLDVLTLESGKIEKIDEGWIKLQNLTGFSASNNPIKSLPTSLPPQLKTIMLSDTFITTLPSNWHSGKRTQYFLDYIDAYNTPISIEEQTKIKETTHIRVLMGKKDLIYDYNR